MDPEEIEDRQFVVTMRGYARDEVDAFREEVAQEIKILRKQLTKANSDLSQAKTEVEKLKARLTETRAQLEEERSRPPEPDKAEQPAEPALPEDRAAIFRMVGRETERILLAAEHAAEQMHERAVKESAEIMTDARLQVQRSMAELEAARRAAEEDFDGIRDARSMVASQLEDIGRRLDETISRLRVPVELPGPKAGRSQPHPDGPERAVPRAPSDRLKEAQAQAEQRKQRELDAARELQARQTAHLGEAGRRETELKAVQAEAERRARAEADAQARERAEREAANRKAQEARAAAAAQDAERLKAAREAEVAKESEEAERAARLEAERLAKEEAERSAREKAEKAAQAEAEAAKARTQAERSAMEEAEKVAKAEAERAAKAKAVDAAKAKAEAEKAARGEPEPPAGKVAESERGARKTPDPDGGSSLNELLEEIRRKREGERSSAPRAGQPESERSAQELDRRNEVLGDLPAQTARRLKRLLQEDHNDLLDRLRTQRGKGTLEENLAPLEEQKARFESGLGETLARAFAEGRTAGGAGGDTDASGAVNKLIGRQVVNPLRTEVSRAIDSGLRAEDSSSALSERANDVFRVWKGVRTQLLGEGISYAAYHQGFLDALGSVPGAKKSWVFSEDEHECPNDICQRNADAGAVALKTAFPSGHLTPPAHGGCTCTLKSS